MRDVPPSVVVFLIALPLSMGIARASGMPAMLGLITAVVGGTIVGFFGGAPLQISGPSAGLSVLVLQWVGAYRSEEDPYGITSIAVIVMIAGLLQAAAGFLRLGTYFRAVSPAVIRGMLAGIGIIIVVKQFHVMIDDDVEGSVLYNIYQIPAGVLKAFTTGGERYHYIAASIGVATLLTIVIWDRFRPSRVRFLPGALAGVLVASIAAAMLQLPIDYVVVKDSLFAYITLPTANTLSKVLELDILMSGAALAFVASAETLLCATAVSGMHRGERTNYDRELAAQGIGNLACGALGALPDYGGHQPQHGQRRGRRANGVLLRFSGDVDPLLCRARSRTPWFRARVGSGCDPDLRRRPPPPGFYPVEAPRIRLAHLRDLPGDRHRHRGHRPPDGHHHRARAFDA